MHGNYRKSSHTVFDVKLHFVWITKYRKLILYGKAAERVHELIREICLSNNVQILKGHISKDNVHIIVSKSPYLSESKLMQYIKGKTSRKLLMEFPEISKKYWGRHMWGRGYFVASSGNVTDEVIMQYIEIQDVEERKKEDDFQISP
jgi:putative transposase